MKSTWQVQEAKARFSEVVSRAMSEGPQRVTLRGKPAVVVISAEDYEERAADETPRKSLLDLIQSCPAPEIFESMEAARNNPDYGRSIDFDE